MILFRLLPLFLLTFNFSATQAPIHTKAIVSVPMTPNKKKNAAEKLIIPWQPERKLLWDDFMCSPKKEGDAVASTSTSLGISYQVINNGLLYHITCHFSKDKSWGSLKTDYILAHEQAHFDITELHARKLYEALNEYQFNPASVKEDIAAIYERIVREKEEMQEAYDGQTDHSRRRMTQYDWLDRIDNLLTETKEFAQYP